MNDKIINKPSRIHAGRFFLLVASKEGPASVNKNEGNQLNQRYTSLD